MALTALEVKNLKAGPKTRRHGDGRGLYLVVRASGGKTWIQRITVDGTRTDMGLGSFPDVSLARARHKSAEIRTLVADGLDPRAVLRQPTLPTFQDMAEEYIDENAATWKHRKTATNWRGCLSTYANPAFGDDQGRPHHSLRCTVRAETDLDVQTGDCQEIEATHPDHLRGCDVPRIH